MMSKKIKRLYQSVLILSVSIFFIFLAIANPVLINSTDFSIYNTGWNGCSSLALYTYNLGQLQPTVTYDYTTWEPVQQSFVHYEEDPVNFSLFIIGPETSFTNEEITYVHQFLSNGGNLLLADDFGSTNTLLKGLQTSSRFSTNLLLDLSFEKNASFVTLFTFTHQSHPLTNNISSLLSNYPSSLQLSDNASVLATSSELSWLDTNRNSKEEATEPQGPFPVLAVEPYGNGSIVYLSAPSLLINSMSLYGSNQAFKSNLISYVSNDKKHVIIDESHRDLLVPFQLGYRFTAAIPLVLKISILLLVVIIFLVLFTPIPKKIINQMINIFLRKKSDQKNISTSLMIQELLRRHPTWNKTKITDLIERLNAYE